MTEREIHLATIVMDLTGHVTTHCPCGEDGKPSDFSGEMCNEAFLMLQDAMRSLESGT